MIETKRMTINTPVRLLGSIEVIQADKGITLTETVIMLINRGVFIEEELSKGKDILMRSPGSTEIERIIFQK